MDDRIDAVFSREFADERLIAGIAFDENGTIGHQPAIAGREIVENDDVFAALERRVNHMRADITRAARDQNGHEGCALT